MDFFIGFTEETFFNINFETEDEAGELVEVTPEGHSAGVGQEGQKLKIGVLGSGSESLRSGVSGAGSGWTGGLRVILLGVGGWG